METYLALRLCTEEQGVLAGAGMAVPKQTWLGHREAAGVLGAKLSSACPSCLCELMLELASLLLHGLAGGNTEG